MLQDTLTSIRLVIVSMLLLCVGYTGVLLAGAFVIAPEGRLGSLAKVDGRIVGSWQTAQAFTRPGYLWPRPSAVNYAADAAGGSNLSPANPLVRERTQVIIERLGASAERPVPTELVLASGAGLDPHVTLEAALYQAPRIAEARGATIDRVEMVLRDAAEQGPAGTLVNVLRANIDLDALIGPYPAAAKISPGDNTR